MIIFDHELIIIRAQFRTRDRADESAGGDVSFDKRHRGQRNAEPVNGGLQR